MDEQAQNNRDVLFASLLIGSSVNYFAMVARAHVCDVCARVCVRESLCAFVCVLLLRCCNENSQTYFCKHPTLLNIHVTKRYTYTSTTTSML